MPPPMIGEEQKEAFLLDLEADPLGKALTIHCLPGLAG